MDPLAEKAYDLTPFRYAFNNPIRIVDPNGAYEEDGHYWTVYLMATQLGLKNARQLADATEWPDVATVPTYLIPGLQQRYHALTGGSADYETNASERMLYAAGDMKDVGIALHRLGDSYAHRTLSDPSVMYRNRFFTLNHAWTDGAMPDEISRRLDLYKSYVSNLAEQLGDKFSVKSNYDSFTFDYISNRSNGTNHFANDAIIETEIGILHGGGTFQLKASGYAGDVSKYLQQRNKHYGSNYSVKTFNIETYTRNENGEFVKKTENRSFITNN